MSDQRRAGRDRFDATIGLGSNIGDKAANIDTAIAMLTRDGTIRLVAQSPKYRSAPWGVTDQDWFVNAAIAVATGLSARDLLRICQQVENDMGRVRQQRWGPRLIDVDVLTYRDEKISEPDLIVPHPLIAQRAFVLLPLRDVAPDVRINDRSLDDLIAALGRDDTLPFEIG
ncbi:MAG TPA: 2-amino-4-hydroxy-6-hydroxymethyldihydropteridine diphosphokinase [Hyphomicrobium sp.]|nr:2-amino-4-hydroxy-6-hydroxymethyldihydropteridine diphosphokinase [Hyphomicrobium sp.]